MVTNYTEYNIKQLRIFKKKQKLIQGRDAVYEKKQHTSINNKIFISRNKQSLNINPIVWWPMVQKQYLKPKFAHRISLESFIITDKYNSYESFPLFFVKHTSKSCKKLKPFLLNENLHLCIRAKGMSLNIKNTQSHTPKSTFWLSKTLFGCLNNMVWDPLFALINVYEKIFERR